MTTIDEQNTGNEPGENENNGVPPAGGASTDSGAGSSSPGTGTAVEAGADAGSEGGTPQTNPQKSPAPASDSWKDKRIAQLTAQLAKAKTQRLPAPVPESNAGAGEPDPALVEQRATELASAREFERHNNEMISRGKETFAGEWQPRVDALRGMVSPNDPYEVAQWNNLLATAYETGKGAEILHSLGGDLNRASELLGANPVKMAVEITKMAAKLETPGSETDPGFSPGASGTPKPIRPVGSGARGPSHTAISPDDPERADSVDIGTWMARRSAQVKERGLR